MDIFSGNVMASTCFIIFPPPASERQWDWLQWMVVDSGMKQNVVTEIINFVYQTQQDPTPNGPCGYCGSSSAWNLLAAGFSYNSLHPFSNLHCLVWGCAHILRNVPGLPMGCPLSCLSPECGSFMSMTKVSSRLN